MQLNWSRGERLPILSGDLTVSRFEYTRPIELRSLGDVAATAVRGLMRQERTTVRRYDPAGKLMREIRFPVANVTKIAFGGEDLRTAYATTARKGLDMTALTKQPLAGDLFAFDPGVAGLPGHVATI